MNHGVHRVTRFEIVGPHVIRVEFDDGTEQVIDFQQVLEGDIYGDLRDLEMFNRVQLDAEAHTLVWPNGADFDPETLHDWPKYESRMKEMAENWAGVHGRGF